MKKISFQALQKKYGGKYILTDDKSGKIIAASKNLDAAFKVADKKGHKFPTVEFIEPNNVIAIYEVSLRK